MTVIQTLLGKRLRDRVGNERRIGLGDILVVAPYNLQLNALKAALPPEARVGTIDTFQGQEAPVYLVSMTSSSADEIPRGMDFLFSLNRINVAVSRAQVLSLVFARPRLLEVSQRRPVLHQRYGRHRDCPAGLYMGDELAALAMLEGVATLTLTPNS